MKTIGLTLLASIVGVVMIWNWSAGTAESRPTYRVAFAAKYTKPDSTDDQEKAFATLIKDTGCFVCHEQGNDRKKRNRFGTELATLLKPKMPDASWKGETDKKKLEDAFAKALETKVDAKDAKSPTYGDLLKAHKLPGGEPKAEGEKKASS